MDGGLLLVAAARGDREGDDEEGDDEVSVWNACAKKTQKTLLSIYARHFEVLTVTIYILTYISLHTN